MEVEEFRKRGKELIDFICDYQINISEHRVTSTVEAGFLRKHIPEKPPQAGEKWSDIFSDFQKYILPGITHWLHPRFHAFFPIGFSYGSMLGEILSDAIACNGFSWAASPSCTELETIVLDWLGQMMGLPNEFLFFKENSLGGGVLQGSASECIFVSFLSARYHALRNLKRKNPTTEEGSLLSSLVAYCSTETHSCVEKAAGMCLVKLKILPVDSDFRLRGETLEEAVKLDLEGGFLPFFAVATIGTTSSASYDAIDEIGPVCEKHDIWLHVDCSYAGSAFICPEFRYLTKGIVYASSLNMNPTKWMRVNYDCSAMWVKNRIKFTECLVVEPIYLTHNYSHLAIDYRHWGVPLSRRFRSLKLWTTIRNIGVEGLQRYIRNHVNLAKQFEKLVLSDNRFEVKSKVLFGLVCFRLKGSNILNRNLLEAINNSGDIYVVSTTLHTKFVIRFCVCYADAKEEDIKFAWDVIRKYADKVLDMEAESASKIPQV